MKEISYSEFLIFKNVLFPSTPPPPPSPQVYYEAYPDTFTATESAVNRKYLYLF